MQTQTYLHITSLYFVLTSVCVCVYISAMLTTVTFFCASMHCYCYYYYNHLPLRRLSELVHLLLLDRRAIALRPHPLQPPPWAKGYVGTVPSGAAAGGGQAVQEAAGHAGAENAAAAAAPLRVG